MRLLKKNMFIKFQQIDFYFLLTLVGFKSSIGFKYSKNIQKHITKNFGQILINLFLYLFVYMHVYECYVVFFFSFFFLAYIY